MRLAFRLSLAMLPPLAALFAMSGSIHGQVSTVRTLVTGTHLNFNTIPVTDTNETDFAAGDVDADGDIDVVVGRKQPFTVDGPRHNLLLLNDGTGIFNEATATHTNWQANLNNTRDVEVVDVDGDGWLDVIFYNSEVEPTEIYLNLGNDAQGTWMGFAPTPTTISGGSGFNTCGGRTCDYDLDGMLDVVRADYRSSWEDDLHRQSAPMVFTNVSSLIPTAFRDSEFGTTVQTDEDLNADGVNDILIIGSNMVKAWYPDGMGGFVTFQQFSTVAAYAGIFRDFNADGLVDIFKINDGTDALHLNLGVNANGTINEGPAITIPNSGNFGANAVSVDFDMDGDLDVFVSSVDVDIPNCGNPRELKLWLNQPGNPSALFVQDAAQSRPTSTYDCVAEDFDGDGIPDLLMSGCGNMPGFQYFVSDPNAMNTTFHSTLTPNANGSLFEVHNIPASPNFTTLWNLFEIILNGQSTAPGPVAGLGADTIFQPSLFPFEPIVKLLPQSPSSTQSYAFQIPTLGGFTNVQLIRSVSIWLDVQAGTFALSAVLNVQPGP